MKSIDIKGNLLRRNNKYHIEWVEFDGDNWIRQERIIQGKSLYGFLGSIFGFGREVTNIILMGVTVLDKDIFLNKIEEINNPTEA